MAEPDLGWVGMYLKIPIITKYYITATLFVTIACNLDFISKYSLHLSPNLIIAEFQIWRLLTPFLYAGPLKMNTAFELFYRYTIFRRLENHSFYRRPADYFFMILLMSGVIIFLELPSTDTMFLGNTLTSSLWYLWCRRNGAHGVITFMITLIEAGLFVISKLFNIPVYPATYSALVAFHVSHLYFFLEDVFPKQRLGFRILKTPRFVKALFNQIDED